MPIRRRLFSLSALALLLLPAGLAVLLLLLQVLALAKMLLSLMHLEPRCVSPFGVKQGELCAVVLISHVSS